MSHKLVATHRVDVSLDHWLLVALLEMASLVELLLLEQVQDLEREVLEGRLLRVGTTVGVSEGLVGMVWVVIIVVIISKFKLLGRFLLNLIWFPRNIQSRWAWVFRTLVRTLVGYYLLENLQSRPTRVSLHPILPFFADSVEFDDIRILRILKSSVHLVQIFFQHQLIRHILGSSSLQKGPGWVHELAPQAVGAVHGIMVLLAEFGLVLAGNVSLLLEFIISVRKSASLSEFALSCLFPILAHLQLWLKGLWEGRE